MYDAASTTNAKLSSVITGNGWTWPGARSNDLVEVQSTLFDIQPCQDKEDTTVWVPSKSGVYHTGATWFYLIALMALRYPGMTWSGSRVVPLGTPLLSGLVILNMLTTKDRMFKWNPSVDGKCIFCDNLESRDHLFLSCAYSAKVWSQMKLIFPCPVPSIWSDIINWGATYKV